MGQETQAMSVRLPAELYERLRRAAFDERVHMSELIIEGIGMRLAMLEMRRVAKERSDD